VYVPHALRDDLDLTIAVSSFLFWNWMVLDGWRVL
jgi:hypothetical protein